MAGDGAELFSMTGKSNERNLNSACEVRSLTGYLDRVTEITKSWELDDEKIRHSGIWFRGHSCGTWQLLPSVLRRQPDPLGELPEDGQYSELKITELFNALYRNYTSERFESRSAEFFAFMQHYGVPTRLLDWTESSLMALYFAVEYGATPVSEGDDESSDPVVWVLNVGRLNGLTEPSVGRAAAPFIASSELVRARLALGGYVLANGTIIPQFFDRYAEFQGLQGETSSKLRHPVGFYPQSAGNLRIATQKGCFTVHGPEKLPIETVMNDHDMADFLVQIRVPRDAAPTINEELRRAGVTPRSVYPNLHGLSLELKSRDVWNV